LAMAENVKAKVEEIRTKIRSRVEEIRGAGILRGGGSSGILSGNPGFLKQLPALTEVREKGLMATARARMERFRGTPAGPAGGPIASSPRVDVSTDTGVKVQRGKVAIEA